MAFVVTAVATAIAGGVVTAAVVATVATSVAYLGATLSVVGAVTGSAKLAKWGGYLGMAGGVVALGATAFGAMTGAASSAASGAASGAATDAATGEATKTLGSEIVKNAGVDTAIKTGAENLTETGLKDLWANAAPPTTAPAVSSASGINTNSLISSGSTLASGMGAKMKTPEVTSSGGISGSVKDWWKSLGEQEKAAALKGVGDMASGLFAGWSQDQKNEFEREKYNFEKEMMLQKTANANAQPIMKFKPVVGLINSKG
jgi:hypothetical protein